MRFFAHLKIARGFAFGDVGIGRRPFRPPFAALKAKAGLLAHRAISVFVRVDCHAAGMNFFIAKRLGAFFEDFVVVVAGQAGAVAGACHAQFVFGLSVPGVHLGPVNRPIQQVCALHIAIVCLGFPFVVLKPQGCASPVGCGAAHGLDDPRRQAGKVFGHAPVAGRCTGIDPGQLPKTVPFIVDIVLGKISPARLQRDNAHAFLRQLVGQYAPACAGSDYDNNRVVGEIKRCRHGAVPPYSQLMSLKPRSM